MTVFAVALFDKEIPTKTMSIDIETFSSEDLRKSGVYRYCEAPDFEILLFAYSVDGGEVQLVDLASGEKLPEEIIKALTDDNVIKWAWNANFERICLSRYLKATDPSSWKTSCRQLPETFSAMPCRL